VHAPCGTRSAPVATRPTQLPPPRRPAAPPFLSLHSLSLEALKGHLTAWGLLKLPCAAKRAELEKRWSEFYLAAKSARDEASARGTDPDYDATARAVLRRLKGHSGAAASLFSPRDASGRAQAAPPAAAAAAASVFDALVGQIRARGPPRQADAGAAGAGATGADGAADGGDAHAREPPCDEPPRASAEEDDPVCCTQRPPALADAPAGRALPVSPDDVEGRPKRRRGSQLGA
jgi:hypothetical protein